MRQLLTVRWKYPYADKSLAQLSGIGSPFGFVLRTVISTTFIIELNWIRFLLYYKLLCCYCSLILFTSKCSSAWCAMNVCTSDWVGNMTALMLSINLVCNALWDDDNDWLICWFSVEWMNESIGSDKAPFSFDCFLPVMQEYIDNGDVRKAREWPNEIEQYQRNQISSLCYAKYAVSLIMKYLVLYCTVQGY